MEDIKSLLLDLCESSPKTELGRRMVNSVGEDIAAVELAPSVSGLVASLEEMLGDQELYWGHVSVMCVYAGRCVGSWRATRSTTSKVDAAAAYIWSKVGAWVEANGGWVEYMRVTKPHPSLAEMLEMIVRSGSAWNSWR